MRCRFAPVLLPPTLGEHVEQNVSLATSSDARLRRAVPVTVLRRADVCAMELGPAPRKHASPQAVYPRRLMGVWGFYRATWSIPGRIFGAGLARSRLPGDQRSTTEFTEIHGKENPNQLPLAVSFPGAKLPPARRVGSFRGYPFVMVFLAVVIRSGRFPGQETSSTVSARCSAA